MQGGVSSYLDQFPSCRTANPEEAHYILTERFGARALLCHGGVEGFYAHCNHLQLHKIGLSYCSYGAPVQLEFSGEGVFRQQFCLQGNSTTMIGKESIEVRPDQSCIICGNCDAILNFGESYEQLVLTIDASVLLQKLTGLIGSKPASRLEFESTVDLNNGDAQNLRQLILLFANQFSTAQANLPGFVLEEIQQTITVAFLCCNRHNFSQLLNADTRDLAPWQVRRVEDYIEANWNGPITIENLAAITETSTRSIFDSFKKSRRYSPMAFVKQVRLRHAQDMLLNPDANTSVTGVAFACGFQNLGHFARDYRQTFGELPSATLGRSKRFSI
jgi:AraC-like DNA-binding protein